MLGLNGNVGFGLAGPSSSGKSTLQLAVASAYGPASDSIGHYRHTFNSTVNGLDELMSVHRDSLLVLDEMGFMDTPVTVRSAEKLYDLILRFGHGDDRRRMGNEIGSGVAHNLVYITSANKTLQEALAPLSWANIEATLVRLMMIPVPERPSGIFEHIPQGFTSVPQALDALRAAFTNHYGVVIRQYLERLVQSRASNGTALVEGIVRRMDAFVDTVGDGASGQDARIIRAFALVAAAGDLAKHFRVLPASFNPEASARACLDLIRQQHANRNDRQTVVERLVTWL